MNWKNLILPSGICLLFSSCIKTFNSSQVSSKPEFIFQARKFFATSTVEPAGLMMDYKNHFPRMVSWGNSRVVESVKRYYLVAPIEYKAPLFVKTEFSGNSIFSLNNITNLVIYRDSSNEFHLSVVTRLPDSNYLKDPTKAYSGYLFVNDWWGNDLGKYLFENGLVKKYHEPNKQNSNVIQVCTVIYGYNYASGDPGGGYSWTESGGCYSLYLPERVDEVALGGSLEGGGGGVSRTINIVVPPPTNPIANITDYIKCFTNVGGSDHTYSVSVCVQQPVPGSRDAYKWVNGGPIGSSGEGNIANVGHTFLIFTEQYGGTTISRNMGFYPATGVKPGSSAAQGQLNNDESHSYNISATFSVTNANFFLMLNSAARGNAPGYDYNLNSENCTTYALQTLAQGGVNLPNTIGSWPGGMGCNPGDLGEDIRQMNALPNMTKSTVQNYHPNMGTCQ